MPLWIFIFLIVPYSQGIQMRETEYECGAHGRFEYCIDGVPGCVIGCHCHPGYYFDTDTKICEPNIRLSQNFRRNYEILEPTRVFIPPTPSFIEETATTVKSAVEEKIDVIAKDADDLGDWLYNQFFKTIENQVINETKDDSILTRRSESSPKFSRKPTRRSHKYWRAKRKRKKKKKGLKSKLLRITEDDSLFDSSSSSTSDESSESSGSSGSSGEQSRESLKDRTIKNDHGHKKIVVFNKRPKPPLPSFIFLPNMETPFFPPIGLPPPPMPMYPMIPVPPMMGPFPFPAPTPACGNGANNGNAGTQPPQTDKTPENNAQPSEKPPDAKPPEEKPPKEDKPPENKPPEDKPQEDKPTDDKPTEDKPTEDKPTDDKPTEDKPADDQPPDDNPPEDNPPEDKPVEEKPEGNALLRGRAKKRRGPRNKLVQKLREKLKRKNKLKNFIANEYQGPPIVPPGFIANHLPNMRHKSFPEINLNNNLATLQDVDFKYLSQLIHRADLNKTKQTPPTTTSAAQSKNMLTLIPLSRRNYYDNYPDQITQVLNNLANQPINIPENQPAYDTPNQLPYSVPNQPTYNVPNQPTYNAPNQAIYNIANQPTNNVPNQPDYNTPNHPTYNAPNQPNLNVPNQPTKNLLNKATYNLPNQPSHNVPNQPTYNVPNQLRPNIPNQPTYNIPNQPSPNVPNQLTYNVPNQSTHNLPNQPTYISLNQPHKIPYRKKIEDTNDLYYANLGRQIASMIRNIDGDKEVDIEIKSSGNIANNPGLTGHSGSRSFWERSVRSPYTEIMNSYKKEIDSLKQSNEDLFSLENKVNIAASTAPTLSLHELENIISKMQKTKSKFIQTNRSSHRRSQSSISSFNVNLLPGNDQRFYSNGKVHERARNIVPKLLKPNNQFNKANARTAVRQKINSPIQPSPIRSDLSLSDLMFTLQPSDEILNATAPAPTYKTNTPAIPTRKPEPEAAPRLLYKLSNPHFKSHASMVLPFPPKPPLFTNMQPPYMQATTTRTRYQQLSPMVLNHKALKYYDGINNNQYLYEKASIPVLPQSFPSRVAPVNRYETYGKRVDPSYFHHEVHHFDYFDDLL